MRKVNTYKLTLLAMLAAIAIIGRIAVSTIPNVQPVTDIVIITGLFLGAVPAMMLAFVIVFVSNAVLGMGIWSVWQVVCWGLIGLLSGLLSRPLRQYGLYLLVPYSVFCGYLFGFLISLPTYQVTGSFWAYYVLGLPFDTNHAIGNGTMILILYPTMAYWLNRYKKKYL